MPDSSTQNFKKLKWDSIWYRQNDICNTYENQHITINTTNINLPPNLHRRMLTPTPGHSTPRQAKGKLLLLCYSRSLWGCDSGWVLRASTAAPGWGPGDHAGEIRFFYNIKGLRRRRGKVTLLPSCESDAIGGVDQGRLPHKAPHRWKQSAVRGQNRLGRAAPVAGATGVQAGRAWLRAKKAGGERQAGGVTHRGSPDQQGPVIKAKLKGAWLLYSDLSFSTWVDQRDLQLTWRMSSFHGLLQTEEEARLDLTDRSYSRLIFIPLPVILHTCGWEDERLFTSAKWNWLWGRVFLRTNIPVVPDTSLSQMACSRRLVKLRGPGETRARGACVCVKQDGLRNGELLEKSEFFIHRILPALFCCSVTKSCLTLWPHGLQHTRLLCPLLSAGVSSNSVHWVSDAVQPSQPLPPPPPFAFNLFQHI